MTKDEALKMAIEALKYHPSEDVALQACKEALAQPAQEPVAYEPTSQEQSVMHQAMIRSSKLVHKAHPAPSWQGLSDDEIDKEALKDDHAAYFALGALWANQALRNKNGY